MESIFDYFLRPKSVAVIGASTRTGPDSFNILEVMRAKGCRAEIYPVNPKTKEILGFRVYPSILDIPAEIDLAVIATGREAVPELVRQCVQKPVKGIVIITQGFADADAEGARLQEMIMGLVSGTGVRVIGPNTLGVVNNFDNFLTAFVNVPHKASPVGLVCQSGMFINGHAEIFGGLGYAVDIGNAADIGFNEVLEFYGRDGRIGVIALHMEGIRGGRRFMELAGEIVRKKPVVVYKTGRTEEGAHAASSHSGSLAGEDHVYEAAFRQAGVIRAETFDELRDFSKTFTIYKSAPGNRVAVVTFTGGGGIALLDAMEQCGLVPARLSPLTMEMIKEIFPGWLEVSNPIDLWPSVMKYGYERVYLPVLRRVLEDPGVDMVACISVAHSVPGDEAAYVEKFILEAARMHPEKPVALWNFGSARSSMAAHVEQRGPVAVYPSPERMARSLGVLYRYHRHILERGTPAVETAGPATAVVAGLWEKRSALLGEEAMNILGKAGIPTVRGKLARDLEEALEAAGEIGFPVALKAVAPEIIHKTEAGGIRLDIRDPEGLENAWRSMMAEVGRKVPGARVDGVLVQKYAAGGIELILGSKRDREFGQVLVFGLGGIYAEVLKDVAFRIAPVSRAEALEMVRETRAYRILTGARGQEPADMEALLRTIVALSELAASNPEINEIDINPLLATPGGVVALDARII
ncbi:MAG: acetate--CoA ligase family protein [Peptococcaceae bacterium]|nr:acetate--CoA ligase family protein [Peptococcaceae bacterium]